MRALKAGGILSVTLWNKEEPPKSVLKLYATMAAAAREVDGGDIADRFFVVSTYLSTATVLYKRGGFTPEEIAKLRAHTAAMSFDEIYYPGFDYDPSQTASVLEGLPRPDLLPGRGPQRQRPDGAEHGAEARRAATEEPAAPEKPASSAVPATTLGQLAWHYLVRRRLGRCRGPLRLRHAHPDQRPAVLRRLREAGRPAALHRPARAAAGRMGLPAAVGDARHRLPAALSLVLLPLVFGWRTIFSRNPGKSGTILYFAVPGPGLHHGRGRPDLRLHPGAHQRHGLGLRADHRACWSSPASAASSPSAISTARAPCMPKVFLAIGALLIGYGLPIDYASRLDRHAALRAAADPAASR